MGNRPSRPCAKFAASQTLLDLPDLENVTTTSSNDPAPLLPRDHYHDCRGYVEQQAHHPDKSKQSEHRREKRHQDRPREFLESLADADIGGRIGGGIGVPSMMVDEGFDGEASGLALVITVVLVAVVALGVGVRWAGRRVRMQAKGWQGRGLMGEGQAGMGGEDEDKQFVVDHFVVVEAEAGGEDAREESGWSREPVV